MRKNKFTDTQMDFLKVAKLNQQNSESLLAEIDACNKSWESINRSTEDDLIFIEQKLGIKPRKEEVDAEDFILERTPVKTMYWEELVKEANEEISDPIDFEDLLTSEEIQNAYEHMDEINYAFEQKTGLQKKDLVFLTVAIALQCTRQYVLDPWLKANRPAAGSDDEKGRKNNTQSGWYYVPTDKILTNKVPFDAQHYADNKTIAGFLKGGDHRLMTLGHDPMLGWIFGTANIMTSTLTRNDFSSVHVKCIDNENKIHSNADTFKIFKAIFDRVSEEGMDGKIAVAYAIVREAIHLKSDVYTKRSLPLPGVGVISLEFGKKLAKYGIDTASVGTEFTLSSFINMIIAMLHRLGVDESIEADDFYEVRTRKIILYSNLIASTSNAIASVMTNRYDLLDVGGILVTMSRFMKDVRFVCRVQEEFVQNQLDVHFEGIKEEIERLELEVQ